MEAGNEGALDAGEGAGPLGVGDVRDALDLADHAKDEGEAAHLLAGRGEHDGGGAADIRQNVHSRHLAEELRQAVERRAMLAPAKWLSETISTARGRGG